MSIAKVIVAYPPPADLTAFEKVYSEEHLPLAMAKISGATKIVGTKIVGAPQGAAPFHRVAEVYFPTMRDLETFAGSPEGKEVLDHAANISTGGAPVILIAEEDTITF